VSPLSLLSLFSAHPAIGPTKVPGLEGITQIAVGRAHNLALRRDGRVMSWGVNNDGELGIGTRFWGFGYLGQGLLGKNLHVPTRLDLP